MVVDIALFNRLWWFDGTHLSGTKLTYEPLACLVFQCLRSHLMSHMDSVDLHAQLYLRSHSYSLRSATFWVSTWSVTAWKGGFIYRILGGGVKAFSWAGICHKIAAWSITALQAVSSPWFRHFWLWGIKSSALKQKVKDWPTAVRQSKMLTSLCALASMLGSVRW